MIDHESKKNSRGRPQLAKICPDQPEAEPYSRSLDGTDCSRFATFICFSLDRKSHNNSFSGLFLTATPKLSQLVFNKRRFVFLSISGSCYFWNTYNCILWSVLFQVSSEMYHFIDSWKPFMYTMDEYSEDTRHSIDSSFLNLIFIWIARTNKQKKNAGPATEKNKDSKRRGN